MDLKKFVNALNPNYELPSRKTVSNTMLPATYEEENFMAVTAHFIDDNFKSHSALLDCVSYGENHTSINLASQLKLIIQEWNLEGKILMVISDNAANIKKAIKEELQLKHFGCYAHTINLIALDSLKHATKILDKVKSIVAFCKRITSGMAKLIDQQKQQGRDPKRLVQDVVTRWNSTYYMVDRFVELEEPIRTTMALLNKDFPVISLEEWNFLKELIHILEPLENVTKLMSAENYVTASMTIILTDGLLAVYKNMKELQFEDISKKIISIILDGLTNRLGNVEQSNSLVLTTFLDPRFKNVGFCNESIPEKAKKSVLSLLSTKISSQNKNSASTTTANTVSSSSTYQPESESKETTTKCSVWGNFEKRVASL
ncbi:zinc finger BED domain-containing protein 1-like [Anoplophora glabripennis]|uniref:zinc finger BED domain-containing protein 1-like n=1 Tax=Anoplophora glabripennis TaxID=217634 RepID=UPI000873C321|nr:zinc finger BED domain-containing protein 1-like [Anoplophora glabripennis]